MRTLLFFLLICFISAIPSHVLAQDTDENSVRLEIEDIRYEEPTPIPQVKNIDYVLYGEDLENFNKHGYVIHTSLDGGLALNMSANRINIDPQPMDTIIEKQINLAVSSDSTFSYQVLGVQQRSLGTSNGSIIENTVCDLAFLPCTSSLARHWTSNTSYGFGYRLKGIDTDKDFHDSNSYRPFPLNSKNQKPIFLMKNIDVGGTRQSELFLKTIFPPTFQEGTYIGDLSIIVLPTL
jgi:hypothetical protein